MHLYHVYPSRSTRVLWLLEEIGEPYELTVMAGEERRTDEHRRRHPLGRVPVLEDGEGFLFESAALCLHLADLYPEAQLTWQPGTHERGLVYQWVIFTMTELERPMNEARRYREDDPARAQAGVEAFAAAVAPVEAALAGNDYLVGGRFSVADLVCAATLSVARGAGLTDGLPSVNAHIDRLEERPARKRAIARSTES